LGREFIAPLSLENLALPLSGRFPLFLACQSIRELDLSLLAYKISVLLFLRQANI
jgi:hypothetical protein